MRSKVGAFDDTFLVILIENCFQWRFFCWCEPVINAVGFYVLLFHLRFAVSFSGVDVFVNDEKTRTFLSLMVDCGFDQCSKLVGEVDDLFRSFDLPPFYEVLSRLPPRPFRRFLSKVFSLLLPHSPIFMLFQSLAAFFQLLFVVMNLEWMKWCVQELIRLSYDFFKLSC